jgi:hypothetical protein
MAIWNPKDPIREALSALCGGKEPPAFVRGHTTQGLTDRQNEELQDWCSTNGRPEWATGIGIIEAAELLVAEAVNNDNIPPAGAS